MTSEDVSSTNELSGRPVLVVSVHHDGSEAVVTLSGELDLDGTRQLADKVRQAVGPGIESLGIDLRGLTFVDSAGLQGILNAQVSCQTASVAFRVISVSPNVARVIELAGLESLLPLDDTA
jgi:anti-sigma B factor antagonist